MNIPVIYEDAKLLVLDKPAGVVVVDDVAGSGDESTESVWDWVKARYNYQEPAPGDRTEFSQRSGIVHRLDKETSGVLLVAKSEPAFHYLKGLFKYRRLNKTYQVVVYGDVSDETFTINAPVQRLKGNGLLFGVESEGREAITFFTTLRSFKLNGHNYTYMYARPKTGRTHQIRVHLRALGHPVVNDAKYASRMLLHQSKEDFSRMMLHAQQVSFTDWDGADRMFESKTDLEQLFPKN